MTDQDTPTKTPSGTPSSATVPPQNSAPAAHTAQPLLAQGKDLSTWFSLLALVVSFAALVVSILETRALDAQNSAAVWPFVSVGTRFSGEGYSLGLRNRGVGPARIQSVIVRLDGEVIENAITILEKVGGEEGPGFGYDYLKTTNISGSVVGAGERVNLFGYAWQPVTRAFNEKMMKRDISVDVCYCSIFDDCWTTNLETKATPIKACPPARGW